MNRWNTLTALLAAVLISGCATTGDGSKWFENRLNCALGGAAAGAAIGVPADGVTVLGGAAGGAVVGALLCETLMRTADADGDGVPDARDKCPGTPKGAQVDAQGCVPDADADGIADAQDKCPGTPTGAKVDAQGCPIDSDADGVADGLDRCPGTPAGAKVDAQGCPIDSDGDGIPDGLDRCQDTPKGDRVDMHGCVVDCDSDGDGVPDRLDRCPNTPAGVKVDAQGCPIDSDADGIPDSLDRCPDTPAGTKVDQAGCPLTEKMVLRGVHFAYDSSEIIPEAGEVLQQVAATFKRYPNLVVEIAGHTDSIGSKRYNQALSERRANAVRNYLLGAGVQQDQLTAKGYGELEPIASNDTAEGRAQNRRTELRILKQ